MLSTVFPLYNAQSIILKKRLLCSILVPQPTPVNLTRRSRQDIKLNPPEETSDDEEATQISARSQARMLNAQQASRFVRIIRRRPGSRRIHQKRSLR